MTKLRTSLKRARIKDMTVPGGTVTFLSSVDIKVFVVGWMWGAPTVKYQFHGCGRHNKVVTFIDGKPVKVHSMKPDRMTVYQVEVPSIHKVEQRVYTPMCYNGVMRDNSGITG